MDYISNPTRNLPRPCQTVKQHDKSKPEKRSLSYADFHHEITKDMDRGVPHKFAGAPQKQRIGKEADEDELVKYMSKLPSYLQRGENLTEKALNVGVLDWGLLQKWQCGQKPTMPYRGNRFSPSSSNTSSSFSTDESSTHSSRGHSFSPTRQRTRRPSLQSHFSSSPMEGPSQAVESSGGIKFQATETTQSSDLNRSENFVTAPPVLFKKPPDIAETRATEGKAIEVEIQKPNLGSLEHNSSSGYGKNSLLFPKGVHEIRTSVDPRDSNLAALANRKSKVCQRSFSEGCKKASHGEVGSDVPYSCPLFTWVESKEPQVQRLYPRDSAAASVNCPSGSSKSVCQPLNMRSNPSRGNNFEAKKAGALPVFSTSIEHSEQKPKKATAERVRSISPFYRLTGGASKISKSLSLNDGSETRNQRSTVNSRPSSGDGSSSDSLKATGRARSSPLRRLLDPLLKPKAESIGNRSAESLERVSVSTDQGCMSSEHVSLARSARVKLGITGCKKTTVNELATGKKHGPSTVQALLRVAVKNGLPLYTLAVNGESNILAATAKMLDAEKSGGFSSIYTFFAIRDVKRTGSWIGQGPRGKSQDYVSNPVAQMKASDSRLSDCDTLSVGARDFVLFSVDLRQADDHTSEFQPNDELAAIVVRFPKKTNSKECLGGGDVQFQPFTVVLPSAVHSLPSKGGPSSLIERWISGGSCDCGGWDLGCKLRVLTNLKKSSSSNRIELFPQGVLQEQQAFSLVLLKEGIYSVEFHSSVSVLQAFAICTALLDTRKQCELFEPRHSVEEKSFGFGEPSLVQNAGTSGPSRADGEGPRYVSYPPHSPVGRV